MMVAEVEELDESQVGVFAENVEKERESVETSGKLLEPAKTIEWSSS